MKNPLLRRSKENLGWLAFLLGLGTAVLLFVPFLIMDNGYFIYYGDFNVQQIPFYRLAHDAVRAGDFGWNWVTDLGVNFVGSYSFYLLGSPFFWLTLPFPSEFVPYMMGPLLILKFACASGAAYLFLNRFVNSRLAVIGGILYAFSGFSIYNVFFNHFHEAIIYFPLMLWGLELLVQERRHGVFACFVFLSALNNYYFFIAQAIFIIIYFMIRTASGGWKINLSDFYMIALEAVIGTACAAVFLMPSYFAVLQNYRLNRFPTGWNALIYSRPQRLYDIIHSFFFPQDIPARPNFFPDADNKWASMSAWLPVFSCTGVIAYMRSRHHKDWLRRILIVCFLCAIIPLFNSMFQLFNSSYYARWYYLMILMMVLATVRCFEEHETKPVSWRHAFFWVGSISAFIALFVRFWATNWETVGEAWNSGWERSEGFFAGLFAAIKNAIGKMGLVEDVNRWLLYVALVALSLTVAAILVWLFKNKRQLFFRAATLSVCAVSLIYCFCFLSLGKKIGNYDPNYVIEYAIEKKDAFTLPTQGENTFVRADMNYPMDNHGLFWNIPSIHTFHSIVPGSVQEFYISFGGERSVASRPDQEFYAIRSLLSCRWLFDFANTDKVISKSSSKYFEQDGETAMPGWTYYDTQNDFLIYENEYYIPMGFTYDYYLTRSEYDELVDSDKWLVMLKGLVVEDEFAGTVSGVLPHLDLDKVSYTTKAYYQDCLDRCETTASSFVYDTNGFTAEIDLEQSELVFFSVPWEGDGWTATVNGEPAEIIRANVGFMAVVCPAGVGNVIKFTYATPGLSMGLIISLVGFGALLIYLLVWYLIRRHARLNPTPDPEGGEAALPETETEVAAETAETATQEEQTELPSITDEAPLWDADIPADAPAEEPVVSEPDEVEPAKPFQPAAAPMLTPNDLPTASTPDKKRTRRTRKPGSDFMSPKDEEPPIDLDLYTLYPQQQGEQSDATGEN